MSWRIRLTRTSEEGAFVTDRLHTRSARRKTVVGLLAGMAIVGWIYVFFGSGLFTVSHLRIEGAETADRGEVEALVYELMSEQGNWVWKKRNLITLHTKILEQELKNAFFLENVIVDKIYPNILRLTIQERKSSLILLNQNRFFMLDRRGFITNEIIGDSLKPIMTRLREPPKDAHHDLSILNIRNASRLVIGEEFVPEERMRTWLNTYEELQDEGFGYRNAILDYTTSTKLVLNMFESYDVYFDLLEPLQPQIESYYVFMRLKDPSIRITSYVDARIPGKVFYK